jgi:hypothetical protein
MLAGGDEMIVTNPSGVVTVDDRCIPLHNATMTKKTNALMEFLIAELKKNPKALFADLKAKADKKRLKLYPISFGRAQALLGIVKSKPRGQDATTKAKTASKSAPLYKSTPQDLSGALDAIRDLGKQRDNHRKALEKIGSVIAEALK